MRSELEKVWELTGSVHPPDALSSREEENAMWTRIKTSISHGESSNPSLHRNSTTAVDRSPVRSERQRTAKSRQWYRHAVVAAFAIASLFAVSMYWIAPITETAPYGEMTRVQLPDGSTVELNSGTTLTYSRGFDGIPFVKAQLRSVNLEGEAFFDIVRSDLPFKVRTFNAEVVVLGTTFNIRAWPGERDLESRITLSSGRISVSPLSSSGRSAILDEPGQAVVVTSTDGHVSEPSETSLSSSLSWREQGFAIKGKSLETVFKELERRYAVEIAVEDSEILGYSMNVLFPKPNGVESILSGICTEKELKFRRTSRGYVVYQP